MVSQEQIQEWKNTHGDVFKVTSGDKVCYLRSPKRKELAFASMASKDNPLAFNEMILKSCWLDGDEDIRTNDAYFMGASQVIGEIIQIKEAKLEKL